jgi:hypothetical protein
LQEVRVRLRWWHALWLPVVAFAVLAWTTNVSSRLQQEDKVAIKTILGVQQKPSIQSFDDEIRVIRWAQAHVLKSAPGMDGIPEYSDREPMNLLLAKSGLCYDRSRTRDKSLTWLGFPTRLYSDKADATGVVQFVQHALLHSQSHEVTEVQTSRGWMLLGSNTN